MLSQILLLSALFLACGLRADEAPLSASPTAAVTQEPTARPTEEAYESEAYSVKGTRLGGSATKMDIPVRDVPGSVSVISDETLKQQNANDWVGAMRNIAGAMPYRTYGGFTQAVMRGLGRNDLLYLFDGVRDAATVSAGSSSPQANNSMENIDRVEVLKGPQAMLYGQGAVAGVINSIRKKPSAREAYSASFGLGQHDEWRASAGAQGPVLGSELSYRLDLGLDDHVGFRKAKESRALASLALGLPLWSGAELNLYGMIERDRYSLDVGIPIDTTTGQIRPGTPLDRRYNTSNDFQTRENAQYLLEFLQDIGSWQLANRTSYMPNEDVYLAAETLTLAAAPSTTVSRGYLYFNTLRYPWMNNLELSGKIELLGEHKVLVGHEYQHYLQHGLGFQGGFGSGLPAIPAVDLFNPVDTAPFVGIITPNRRTVVTNAGQAVYAQDYWTLHDSVKVLVGGRYDDWRRSQFLERLDQIAGTKTVLETFSTTTAATAAPVYKAGLVLGPFLDTTLYVAQGNSYFPNFKADDAQGRVSFDPETGEMLEGGLKFEGM